ncbi:MAG: hypothetical protein ACOY9Y_09290 [Bacillota bacterium]
MVSLSIIVGGPIEDLLNYWIINGGVIPEEEQKNYIELVNHLTSITFLILLGYVVKDTAAEYSTKPSSPVDGFFLF